MPEPQNGGRAFQSSPIRGSDFITGVQLNQINSSLTLVQSFFLMWFLRLVLNSDPQSQPLFTCYSILSGHGGEVCPRIISVQHSLVGYLLQDSHCARHRIEMNKKQTLLSRSSQPLSRKANHYGTQ